MSNKSLFITVVVVIIVLVVAFVAYSAYQKHQTVVGSGQAQNTPPPGPMDLSNNTPTPPVATSTPTTTPTSTPAMATSSPIATTNGACVRNFSQTELNNNANMDIQNKFVTIDVAGFGNIKIQLYDQDAPKTVENFLRLTDAGYYNCLTFHRVAQGFVIQGGDPNGDGSGGTSAYGAPFADEINTKLDIYNIHTADGKTVPGYSKGTLAMANSGPNTNGSQFFIMLDDLPTSPTGFQPLYTIFGHVVSGQDVVDKIGQTPITPVNSPEDGKPVTPVVMQKLTIN